MDDPGESGAADWDAAAGRRCDRERIVLQGIEVFGRHGVHGFERDRAWPFVVDVEMELDLERASRLDDLRETVNYGEAYRDVVEVVSETSFYLLEALADAVASRLMEKNPPVRRVVVRVHKPRAPLPGPFRDVFVEIGLRRDRDERPRSAGREGRT